MKYVIFTLSIFTFLSCKDPKQQNSAIDKDAHQENSTMHDHNSAAIANTYDNSWTNEMALNDGVKWDANQETNEGVDKMKNHLESYTTATIEEYHTLASALNEDKNFVIKNCTMKGASHDNLHVWLMPLIDKIEALSETKSVDEASKIKQSIGENVNAYSNYFQ